jgi:hypothetical protein
MTTPGFLGGSTERMRALSTRMTGGADEIGFGLARFLQERTQIL